MRHCKWIWQDQNTICPHDDETQMPNNSSRQMMLICWCSNRSKRRLLSRNYHLHFTISNRIWFVDSLIVANWRNYHLSACKTPAKLCLTAKQLQWMYKYVACQLHRCKSKRLKIIESHTHAQPAGKWELTVFDLQREARRREKISELDCSSICHRKSDR